VRERTPAIVLEWAKHWIGQQLVARAGQETAGIVAAKIVAVRYNRGRFTNVEVYSR
jgi:hypothetical protein